MSILAKLIGICFPQNRYSYLNKKDDDYGITDTKEWEEWLTRNPVPRNIEDLKDREISEYAKQIIFSLNRIPITSSNLRVVKEHLYKIAEHDEFLQEKMIYYIKKLKIDQKFKLSLSVSVALAYNDR